MRYLENKCLKKDGKPKKRTTTADLKRLGELQARYDAEHVVEFPDGARIEGGTIEIILNVCGRQVVKTVPA